MAWINLVSSPTAPPLAGPYRRDNERVGLRLGLRLGLRTRTLFWNFSKRVIRNLLQMTLSILNQFSDIQTNSLEDYVERTVMLRFNNKN